jgi:excisionase family DNA binding protein
MDRGSNKAMTVYKVPEVAARLSCSPSFVYEVIASGELPHYRLGKGQGGIRVSEAHLQQFLAGRERGTHPVVRPAGPVRKVRPRHLDV